MPAQPGSSSRCGTEALQALRRQRQIKGDRGSSGEMRHLPREKHREPTGCGGCPVRPPRRFERRMDQPRRDWIVAEGGARLQRLDQGRLAGRAAVRAVVRRRLRASHVGRQVGRRARPARGSTVGRRSLPSRGAARRIGSRWRLAVDRQCRRMRVVGRREMPSRPCSCRPHRRCFCRCFRRGGGRCRRIGRVVSVVAGVVSRSERPVRGRVGALGVAGAEGRKQRKQRKR